MPKPPMQSSPENDEAAKDEPVNARDVGKAAIRAGQ